MSTTFTMGCLLWAVAVSTPWPGGPESSIPITGASSDLSGATWNTSSQSLWVVRQNRTAWEFQWDATVGSFQQVDFVILPLSIGGDIEACAQVDHDQADELYTLDENDGLLSRVSNLGGSPAIDHQWLLSSTNNGFTMPAEVGGLGPEALEFVPDEHLLAAGFRYPDGSSFTGSVNGMGGLIFVGHQVDGLLHVFDVNPGVSDEFTNHGSFETAANEIAGLHFDRSSGLMYIWHNVGSNSLELSFLGSEDSLGTIDTWELYDSGMPSGNLEGIAMVSQDDCGQFGSDVDQRVLFFTRDGASPYLSACEAFPCSLEGACCITSGCTSVTLTDCSDAGGVWLGDGVSCDECSALCFGDLDDSGSVDVEDLLQLLAAFGVDDSGDCDGDGDTDVADLLLLIDGWGEC
ncbi:MAG: hypothetical protein MK116_13860 [Phycisphaerales bacterium]|nr:hypothetical protein [Phycisphaerales bacterium]